MRVIRLNELGRPGKRQSVQGNGIRAALGSTVINCKGSKTEEVGDGAAAAVRKYHVVTFNVESMYCLHVDAYRSHHNSLWPPTPTCL